MNNCLFVSQKLFILFTCFIACCSSIPNLFGTICEVPYVKIGIYQANWLSIPERPLSVRFILLDYNNSRRQPGYADSITSASKIKGTLEAIRKCKSDSTLLVNDLRMVCLFKSINKVDTLIIDSNGNAHFLGKLFHVSNELGEMLKIRDSELNPTYKLPQFKNQRWD
jgi:hypothetical protein